MDEENIEHLRITFSYYCYYYYYYMENHAHFSYASVIKVD